MCTCDLFLGCGMRQRTTLPSDRYLPGIPRAALVRVGMDGPERSKLRQSAGRAPTAASRGLRAEGMGEALHLRAGWLVRLARRMSTDGALLSARGCGTHESERRGRQARRRTSPRERRSSRLDPGGSTPWAVRGRGWGRLSSWVQCRDDRRREPDMGVARSRARRRLAASSGFASVPLGPLREQIECSEY
jgi:hypothetical protein